MRRIARFLLTAAMSAAAAGCSYKPLKAPCAPDEGGLTIAYSSLRADGPGASMPRAVAPIAQHDGCGPLKPI